MDHRDSLVGMRNAGGATGPELAEIDSAIERVSTTLERDFDQLARCAKVINLSLSPLALSGSPTSCYPAGGLGAVVPQHPGGRVRPGSFCPLRPAHPRPGTHPPATVPRSPLCDIIVVGAPSAPWPADWATTKTAGGGAGPCTPRVRKVGPVAMVTPDGAGGAGIRPNTPFKKAGGSASPSPSPSPSLPAAPPLPASAAKRRLSDGAGKSAVRQVRRTSSGRKIPVADKKKWLKEIVGRLVEPDRGELIPLGQLAARATAAYHDAHGHATRCTSPLLEEWGFTVEELEVCKLCGKRALKENCGGHYISRSVVWSPNSTKRKMVSARWKGDGAAG